MSTTKTFTYKAKNVAGKTSKGKITARDQAEASAILRKQGLNVLDVQERSGLGSLQIGTVKPGVKKGELELFTRQLATMISAGIPLLECLEVLHEQVESPGFKKTIHGLVTEIRGGSDFSAALARYPKVYTRIYVSMVKAGEASGQLDDILVRLAEYLEATAKLKREIKSAMTYPIVSMIMVVGITAFLMVFIIPKFKEIFDNLGVELPGITKFVMGISLWMEKNILVCLGGMVGFFLLFSFWRKSPAGQKVWDRVVLTVPVFGPLFRKVALSRFSRTFSTMIKSGVPILGSLEIVAETAGNSVISRAVENAMESVRHGETLAAPLEKEKVFPPMVVRMIGIGERSGALEALLSKISEFYDQQVEAEVKSLTSLIEPLLIGIMGFVVGGIVMSVFLPIFKLQEALTPK